MLSNNRYDAPNPTDPQRFAKGKFNQQEKICIEAYQDYGVNLAVYRDEQETRPLQLAIAMTDRSVDFPSGCINLCFITLISTGGHWRKYLDFP